MFRYLSVRHLHRLPEELPDIVKADVFAELLGIENYIRITFQGLG